MGYTIEHQNVFPVGYDTMELVVIKSEDINGAVPLKMKTPVSVIAGVKWINGTTSAHTVITASIEPGTRILNFYEARVADGLYQCFLVFGV